SSHIPTAAALLRSLPPCPSWCRPVLHRPPLQSTDAGQNVSGSAQQTPAVWRTRRQALVPGPCIAEAAQGFPRKPHSQKFLFPYSVPDISKPIPPPDFH